jgi:hypothetical protein
VGNFVGSGTAAPTLKLAPFLLCTDLHEANMRLISPLGLGALLLFSGCFDDPDYEETRMRGDLGRGTFVYGCYNDSDTSCDTGNDALPKALAVGSRFDVRFSIESGAQPTVIAPVGDLVRRVGGAFEVQGAGEFALLAVNGNSEVLDLKHLRAAEVAEIRVQQGRALPSATLELAPKQSVELAALPFAAGGVALGGALEYGWSTSDEKLLSVESLPKLHRVRVRAGSASGRAVLRCEAAGATFEVIVKIGSGESASDAGAADAGGPADAGTTPDAQPSVDPRDAAAPDAAETDAAATDPSCGPATDDAGGDL